MTSTSTVIASILSVIIPPTARAAIEALATRGVTGAAAAALAARAAPERHLARVRYALALALAHALVWDEGEAEEVARLARVALDLARAVVEGGEIPREHITSLVDVWAVIALDAGGVGGRQDAEGIGTARHPGLHLAGKGRKRASDGPAWDAALAGAAGVLQGALASRGIHHPRLAPDPTGGCDMLGVQWSPDPLDPAATSPACWQGVPCAHPRWVRAEALRQLQRAGGVDAPRATLAGWAAVYNRAAGYLKAGGAVGAIRDHSTEADRALLWRRGAAGALEEMDPEGAIRWARIAEGAGAELVPVPVYHADHGIPPVILAWAWYHAPEGFFARTWAFPGGAFPCGLHGPAMGDVPVGDEEVIWHQRTPDRPASRCVRRPIRTSDQLTVIGIRGADGTGQIFTAYGGPLAPRETGDPTLPAEGPERAESEAFWAQHALSMPAFP